MQRRSFLASILTAGAAPAIIKADSLMKLWVPPARRIIPVGYLSFSGSMNPPAIIWDRALTHDEIAGLTKNPWVSFHAIAVL